MGEVFLDPERHVKSWLYDLATNPNCFAVFCGELIWSVPWTDASAERRPGTSSVSARQPEPGCFWSHLAEVLLIEALSCCICAVGLVSSLCGGVSGSSVFPSGINKAWHYYLDGPPCLSKSHQPPAALCSSLTACHKTAIWALKILNIFRSRRFTLHCTAGWHTVRGVFCLYPATES